MLSKGKVASAKIVSINSMLMEIETSVNMATHQILRLNEEALATIEEVKKSPSKASKFIYKVVYDSSKLNFTVGQKIDMKIVNMDIDIKPEYFGSIIMPDGKMRHKYGGETLKLDKKILSQKSSILGKKHQLTNREDLSKSLETGIAAIDVFNTVSMGQRLAIVGKSKTGKSHLASSLYINPAKQSKDLYMIYAFIGETHETVSQIRDHLSTNKSLRRTILIHSNPASKIEQYLTPYIALAMAENLQKAGKDVVVVLDNLTTHARVCSEIAILNNRPVGRDVMPGDLFHVHSSILERGGAFKNGGSITVFPIIHVDKEDFSSVVASNIISITDGQLLLSSKMASAKKYPAIDLGRSISRIGYLTMPKSYVKVAKKIKDFYFKYKALRDVYGNAKVSYNPKIAEMLKKGTSLENLLIFSLKKRNTFNLPIEMFFLKFIEWGWNDIFTSSDNLLITSFIWMTMYDPIIKKELKSIVSNDKEVNWIPLKLYIENALTSVSKYAFEKSGALSSWTNDSLNKYAFGYTEERLKVLFSWLEKVRDKSNGGWEYDF